MSVLFLEYPKCGTCQKAKRWLDEHGVDYADRHIVEENPTAEELREWSARAGVPVKKLFNTSGMKYRELGLKDRLPELDEAARLALLGTDGMLVKRPLVVGEDFLLAGFRPAEWERLLK